MDKLKEVYGIKGFTVQFSQPRVPVPQPGAILKFDKVLSNVDRCYDPSTGIFTAKVCGIYSFYLSGVAATDKEHDFIDLAIARRHNDSRPFGPLARVFLKSYGDYLSSCQGSSSVKVKLEKGEQIVVRHMQGDLSLKGQGDTTFSGVLDFEYATSVP